LLISQAMSAIGASAIAVARSRRFIGWRRGRRLGGRSHGRIAWRNRRAVGRQRPGRPVVARRGIGRVGRQLLSDSLFEQARIDPGNVRSEHDSILVSGRALPSCGPNVQTIGKMLW
jgi:hypothetical protein